MEVDIPVTQDGVLVSGSFKMPAGDVTVYAEWEAAPGNVEVTFETNGGSAVEKQIIEKGGKATRPSNPVKEGYNLREWYEDEACTTRFNFSNTIDSNIKLYAYWTKTLNGFKLHSTGVKKNASGNYELDTDALEAQFEKDSAEVTIDVTPLATDYDTANLITEEPTAGTEYYFHVYLEDVDGVEGKPTVYYSDSLKSGGTDATADDAAITLEELSRSPGGKYATLIFKYVKNKKPAVTCTVRWLDGDGSELDSKTYAEGEPEPTTDKMPVKAEDENYTYTFDKWDDGTVDGTTKTYTPQFTAVKKPGPAPTKVVYWIEEGTEVSVSKNADKPLKLTAHRSTDDHLTFGKFTGIRMDGKDVGAAEYTAASGSLKLEVKAAYINKLSAGKHKLLVTFEDGAAEITVNVRAAGGSDIPKTGDDFPLWLVIAIAAAALIGLAAVMIVWRRRA